MKKLLSLLLTAVILCSMLAVFTVPVSADDKEPQITLQISGMDKRNVLSLDYGFKQAVNTQGQIADVVKADGFTIRVEGANDDNNDLFEWAVDPSKNYNLSLEFTNSVDGGIMKTIKLTNAYCVGYTEHWDNSGNYYEEIRVTTQEYENGSAIFENVWR